MIWSDRNPCTLLKGGQNDNNDLEISLAVFTKRSENLNRQKLYTHYYSRHSHNAVNQKQSNAE
jgi:hypothetical protein